MYTPSTTNVTNVKKIKGHEKEMKRFFLNLKSYNFVSLKNETATLSDKTF